MKKIALIILAWVVSFTAQAQQETTSEIYIVELESGSKFEAEINEWIIGEYIDLKTEFNSNLIIPAENITKVIQKKTLESSYLYPEKGYYASAKGQFITGNEGQRARHVNGVGFSISGGKKWHRLLNLGVGIGYDRYIWKSGENLVPIFLEYTAFLNKRTTSLYVNVQSGYSLAFADWDYLQADAKGGFMVYPAAGLRMGSGQTKVLLDVGYKFQNAQFTYRDAWSPTTKEQTLTYRRLCLRLGILI